MWCWSPTTGTIWGEPYDPLQSTSTGSVLWPWLLALALTGLLFFGEALGVQPASAAPGYAYRLFDDSCVHTVDLQVEDWAAVYRGRAGRRNTSPAPPSSTGRRSTRWACGPKGTTPCG